MSKLSPAKHLSTPPAAAVVFGAPAGPGRAQQTPKVIDTAQLSLISLLSLSPLSVILLGIAANACQRGDKVLKEGTVTRTGVWVRIPAACARSSLPLSPSLSFPTDLTFFPPYVSVSEIKKKKR